MSRTVLKCALLAAASYAAESTEVADETCSADGTCEAEDMKTSLLQRHKQATVQASRDRAEAEAEAEEDAFSMTYEARLEYMKQRKQMVLSELEGCEQARWGQVGGCDAPCGRATCRQRIQGKINHGWAVFDAVKRVDTDCIDACYCSVTDFGGESPLQVPELKQEDLEQICPFKSAICGASPDAPGEYTGPTNQCSAADKKLMEEAGPGSQVGAFQEVIASCSRKAYSFTEGIVPSKLTECVKEKVPLSDGCLGCFVFSSTYGVNNCKIGPCIQAWCSEGCMACSSANAANVNKCVGFEPPQAPACLSPGIDAPTGPPAEPGCSPDDFAKMNAAGPGNTDNSFPGILAGCSREAFSFTLGIVEDKFNTCLSGKLGLSGKCTKCFAEAALWNINNCKIGPCIQSWCSAGCQACSDPHAVDVERCTGGKPPATTICVD